MRVSNAASAAHALDLELADGVAIERETNALGEAIEPALHPDAAPTRPLPSSGLRTLELRLTAADADTRIRAQAAEAFRPLTLPWTLRGFGAQGETARDGGFDGSGRRFPLELAPPGIDAAPVPFDLSHIGGDRPDTALAGELDLEIEPGWAELWLLCAAVDGDAFLESGRGARSTLVPDWRAPLLVESRWPGPFGFGGVRRGEFRRRPVVWSAGHLHDRRGDDLPVERASLFAVRLALVNDAGLDLAPAPGVRIVAATLARRPARGAVEAFAWPEP